MEPNLGDTAPATTSEDGAKAYESVVLGSKSKNIVRALTEESPEFVESDMQEIHNHWQATRRKWLNVRYFPKFQTKNDGNDVRGNMGKF